ncbi:MAG: MFS transporter [Dethiobacteria bacterium]|jgi:ACDE family multidrug resistance protein|nr:MFS transporter [Bacillota bacterium]
MKTSTKVKVASLGATNFIVVLVNTILFPVFPQIKEALNIGMQELSLLHISVSFPSALINPLGGILADRWGRKKVMIPSLILYGFGGLVAGASIFLLEKPFYTILLGRLLQGIGSATPMFLTIALAGDIFQSDERTKAIGYLEAANSLGKLFSPIIGGFISLIAWYAPFFSYIIFTIPVIIAIWLLIDEPEPKRRQVKEELKSLHKLKNPSNILAMCTAFLVIFVTIGTMFWLSNVLEDRLNIGKVLRGFVISLPVMALMATTIFAHSLGKKLGIRLMMIVGLFLIAAAMVGIAFLLNTHLFWLFIALVGIGAGLLLPSLDTVSTALSSGEHRGVFTTIFGSIRCLGSAVAPYVFTILLKISLPATFLPIASVSILLGIAILLLFQEDKILPKNLRPQG